MNSNKIILSLCSGTGSWEKPYKDSGYIVHSITLPYNDVTKITFDADNIYFNGMWHIYKKDIYGILAAPPCTHFSLARTTAKTPRDFTGAMEIVKACLNVIWNIRADHKLAFWALENPMGYLRQFLGKPPLTFNPYEFGDPHTKKTDLWGYYNMPKKNPVKLTGQQIRDCSINNRILPKGKTQAERRAITPAGFAKAFYMSNK